MVRRLIPIGSGLVEQALDAFIPELLAGLQKGTGDDEGTLARQQYIDLIDELSQGNMVMPMMAQTSRSMGVRRRCRVTPPSSWSRAVISSGGMRSESGSS
ncbi:hypothetical protein AERO9A_250214 [Aeromonas salmonicida]|nr:hypothetical protein AERO9A_250214 [Aeromonas salmonicida]